VSFPGSTGGAASEACGLTVLSDFLAHKGSAADTSCVAGVPEVSFTGSPGLARTVFGTQDLWEN
jgi:hypothetical protein